MLRGNFDECKKCYSTKLQWLITCSFNYHNVIEFIRLLDNYEMNTTIKEYFTEEKMNETWDFLNAVMETKVMQRTNEFLSTWGFAPKDREQFKAMLFEMWFAFDHPRE